MGIKLTLLILLCVSCGAKVNVPTTLKDASLLKSTDVSKSGIAQKNPRILIYGGKSLEVSKYSSKGAHQFYESLPNNAQIPVRFVGGVGGSEVIIEEINKAP